MPLEDSTLALETRLQEDLDILWALVGSYLVFFMQAGFAMLEAGTVRKQNTVNILIKASHKHNLVLDDAVCRIS